MPRTGKTAYKGPKYTVIDADPVNLPPLPNVAELSVAPCSVVADQLLPRRLLPVSAFNVRQHRGGSHYTQDDIWIKWWTHMGAYQDLLQRYKAVVAIAAKRLPADSALSSSVPAGAVFGQI